MDRSRHYRAPWERYWSSIKLSGEPAFWDCEPEDAVALELPHFADLMDRGLPLIDYGCGNGTQTHFLARHFPSVIGIDISPTAIDLAAAGRSRDNLRYLQLDASDAVAVEKFHAEIGEANLYMRGVLHQIRPEDETAFAAALHRLMGARGVIYLKELAPEARDYMRSLTDEEGARPAGLRRLFESGVHPGGVSRERVLSLFPTERFEVLREGAQAIPTLLPLADGEPARVPAHYMVLRAARGNADV